MVVVLVVEDAVLVVDASVLVVMVVVLTGVVVVMMVVVVNVVVVRAPKWYPRGGAAPRVLLLRAFLFAWLGGCSAPATATAARARQIPARKAAGHLVRGSSNIVFMRMEICGVERLCSPRPGVAPKDQRRVQVFARAHVFRATMVFRKRMKAGRKFSVCFPKVI